MDDKDQEQEILHDDYVSPVPSEFQWRNWLLFHKLIHSGDNSTRKRKDRINGSENGHPDYDKLMQLNAIKDAMQVTGATNDQIIKGYGPGNNGSKIVNKSGTPVGVEAGYAFEKIAFGKVLSHQDMISLFQSYYNNKSK